MTSAAIQILQEAGALAAPGLLEALPAVAAFGPDPRLQPRTYRCWLLKYAVGVLIGPWDAPKLARDAYLAGPFLTHPARVQAISS